MRWLALIFACGLVIPLIAEPEPKKYKPEPKEKQVKDVKAVDETLITEDEKTFLREIEAKFGIKDDKFDDVIEDEEEVSTIRAPEVHDKKEKKNEETKNEENPKPFPAVIAIEIVNDTNAESKGKRTIDANLGYGYRTNTGYSYTYFGKPKHEQGKFMIYPYSQEDIPPARSYNSFHYNSHQPPPKLEPITKPYYQPQYSHRSKNVEIQPSQAYELVEVTEQPGNSYSSHGALSEISSDYERVKSHEQPPPPPPSQNYVLPDVNAVNSATLFTTYNGGQISDLSGNFPSVMPNYFIDSSQLLRNPLFKSVGLTSDHIRQHGPKLEQPVVPVLILRIPSTHLNNPGADLYPNLPANYPLSNYLNRLNLQNLVAQYFKKVGYPHVPEIMTHYDAPAPTQPTHYSLPTQNQYSVPNPTPVYHHQVDSVPYSPVPTVEAKYPVLTNLQPVQHYSVQQPNVEPQYHYEQPAIQTYQYVSNDQNQPEIAYQPQYEAQPQYEVSAHYQSQPQYQTQYQTQPQYQYVVSSAEQQQSAHTEYQQTGVSTEQEAEYNNESHQQVPHNTYGIQTTLVPEQQEDAPHSAENNHADQPHVSSTEASNIKESMVIPLSHTQAIYDHAHHPNPNREELQVTENYPSKSHTQIKLLPDDYNKHVGSHVQSITYVTPPPHKRYQYRIMAPQMPMNYAHKSAAYVHSRPLPSPSYVMSSHESSTQDSPTEYKLNTSFLPQVGVQRTPQYPRYYHAHPKHSVRPEHKRVITVSLQQKKRESNEKKTASPPK